MRGMRLILALLILLAAPAVAHADSIVYLDQGNVWSAHPDGSGKVQLTTGGGWHSPTQADDGTVAAVQGTGPIVVMARDGRPLHTITTHEARSGDGGTFAPRPVELSFSPDGTKLAYAYVANSCPVASTCGSIQRSTFYTAADVTDATPVDVYGNQFGVSDPEWVTNSRTLVFGGYGSQVSIDDLGPGDYSQVPWMVPNGDMGDGEVTRDGTRLAVTFDYGANKKLGFFAVKGDVRTQTPPPYPDAACTTSSADELFADPSWAPDGSAVAFADKDGVEIMRFAEFGPDHCVISGSSVLSPTATEPDWGPADPPAAAYTPGSGAQGGGGVVAPPAKKTLSFKAPRVTVAALRKGLVVRFTAAGRVTAKLTLRGRTLAHGTSRGKTVRLSKMRRASKLRGKTLKLTLTVKGTRATATRSVKVR
jgi:hypothetical protein